MRKIFIGALLLSISQIVVSQVYSLDTITYSRIERVKKDTVPVILICADTEKYSVTDLMSDKLSGVMYDAGLYWVKGYKVSSTYKKIWHTGRAVTYTIFDTYLDGDKGRFSSKIIVKEF